MKVLPTFAASGLPQRSQKAGGCSSAAVMGDDGTTQQVQAVIPITTETAKFVHLSVTAPP